MKSISSDQPEASILKSAFGIQLRQWPFWLGCLVLMCSLVYGISQQAPPSLHLALILSVSYGLGLHLQKYRRKTSQKVDRDEVFHNDSPEFSLQTLKDAICDFDIVVFTDAKGIILQVNDNFCRVSKYTRDEIIGKTHSFLNSGFHPPIFYKNLYRTINDGKVWKGVFCNKAKDGSLYWVDSIIYPQHNTEGKITGFLAIRHEITEQVNLLNSIATTQKRMEVLIENSPLGIIEIDNQFSLVQMNPVFAKLLGQSTLQLQSKSLISYIHPDDLEHLHLAIFNSGENSGEINTEHRIRVLSRDGQPIWVRFFINKLQGGRHICMIENIQDAVENENRIRRKRERLNKLFSLSKDIISITTIDGKLVFGNSALEEVTGYSGQVLQELALEDLIHPQDRETHMNAMASLMQGSDVMWEARLKTNFDTYRLVLWKAVVDVHEKEIYSIGRDITESRKSELKQNSAAKMASLAQVASGLAHEINNPLAIIRGRLELIRRQIVSSQPDLTKQIKFIDNADENVSRISTIMDAIRIFASPMAIPDYYEEIRALDLIEKALNLFHHRLKSKGIQIHIQVEPMDFIFLGRSQELIHTIGILVGNSIDSIYSTDSTPWIRIRALQEPDGTLIEVQDSGSGIDASIQNKIMDPFFSTKPQGMGLGLSVANGLVSHFGGTLTLQKEAPFTTFQISLPSIKKNQLKELKLENR